MSNNSVLTPLHPLLEKIAQIASTLSGRMYSDQITQDDAANLQGLHALAKKAVSSTYASVRDRLNMSRGVATAAISSVKGNYSFIDPRDEDLRVSLISTGVQLIEAIAEIESKPHNLESNVRLESFQSESDAEVARQERERQLLKSLKQAELGVSDLRGQLDGFTETIQAKIGEIDAAYQAAQADIDEKTAHINRVTGQATARMIAGDYDKSAAEEKQMADYLRYGALACMLLIVGILGWAVYETTGATFELDRFLSKISLVFLLGVPAAYLARESAKHREQQYHHLQTSLDMKAISPFLASLPEGEQHKLKAIIATRIFGGRDFSGVSNDPYPINAQELLVKFIDKVEFSSKPEKVKKKPADGASAAPAE